MTRMVILILLVISGVARGAEEPSCQVPDQAASYDTDIRLLQLWALPACVTSWHGGDATTWDAGYGGCSHYTEGVVPTSFKYCKDDGMEINSSTWLTAAQVCVECKQCGLPTAAPTLAPAVKAAPPQAAASVVTQQQTSAVGDPHLQNIFGERFDLLQRGVHTLANIPRGSPPQDALLLVTARADHIGGQCADMYFEVVNVTGEWAEETAAGGLHFDAGGSNIDHMGSWMQVGRVQLKVSRGHLDSGTKYLNLFLKNLGKTGLPVGGLLGEDSHDKEATPSAACRKGLSLLSLGTASVTESASIAVAES